MVGGAAGSESSNGWLQGDVSHRWQLFMALVSIGVAAALTATPLLRPFEDWSMDQRLSLQGERVPDHDVVVIAINQPSLDALGERWPIRRRHYADLIDRLSSAGAKAIAFTAEFDAETSPEDDTPMIESMRHARTVVLAASATDRNGKTHVLGGPETQQYAHVRVGSLKAPGDYDKTIRHLEWSIQGLPTLPLAVSRRFGRQPDHSVFNDGRAWIDIRGRPCAPDRPSSCAIPTYGFSDVLRMSARRARDAFDGKAVVVGATAVGTNNPLDVWGPGHDLTSAPHLVALEVATALRGFPLRQAGWLLSALFLVAGGILPMAFDGLGRRALGAGRQARNALNGWFGALLTGGFGALGIGVLCVIAVLAFDDGTVIPVGAPLLAAFLATNLGVICRYHADTLNAQRLFAAADSVVPKEYVRELLARSADPDLDTPRKEQGTVIFVDAVGFTVLTTALMGQAGKTPDECMMDVRHFVSKFQRLVIEAVFKHDGVVVDLRGDGVLAAFGLVGHSSDHEELALRATYAVCTDVVWSMREWMGNQGWQDLLADHRRESGELEGSDEFDIQVGLDSGDLVVGLIGHKARYEFSVIAPATIRATRLKDEAKRLKVTMCASSATFNDKVSPETRELIAAERLDELIELRGEKGKPTIVYIWKRDDAQYGPVAREAVRG
ncbi:MAG: CHASE2 domain-containing protein [Solirubrobacteraceae bacterium]